MVPHFVRTPVTGNAAISPLVAVTHDILARVAHDQAVGTAATEVFLEVAIATVLSTDRVISNPNRYCFISGLGQLYIMCLP